MESGTVFPGRGAGGGGGPSDPGRDHGGHDLRHGAEERVLEFLEARPGGLEVVLTGRSPSERILGAADYVSEIQKVRHPYDRGILARKGIEY